MSDLGSTTPGSTEPHESRHLGLRLAVVALVLPLLSGAVLCFVTSSAVAIGIGVATIVATAALVAVDAARLGRVDRKGRRRESAGLLFVGMCLLWIVVYPVAFFRRGAFQSPNLGVASLFVAAFFVAGPYVASMVIPARLPLCTSTEVAQVLEQFVRSGPEGAIVNSVDGFRELSYDPGASIRHGECVVHTDSGDYTVKFIVEWKDREQGVFQVRLSEPELPSCTSAEVAQLVEQVILSMPDGASVASVDGYRELSYDRGTSVRHGSCVAHTESGDIPLKFIVEWQDRSKGLFQVQVLPSLE